MKTRMFFTWIAVSVVASAGPAAPARSKASSPDAGTPTAPAFTAGFTWTKGHDATGATPVQLTFWYPSRSAESELSRGPYSLHVAPNAPAEKGPFGLVVISHGAGGSPLGHHDLGEALARRGWIVVAPTHDGDNERDHSAQGTPKMWRNRPAELSAAIDAALAHPTFGSRIDRARIAALGYSAGGYSVLAALGAPADLGRIARHCKAHPEDKAFCAMTENGASLAHVDAPLVRRPPDRRIRAAVLLAPVVALFDDAAFKGIAIPIRILVGAKDEVLLPSAHAARLRKLLPRPAEFESVPGAGHYAFLIPFPADWRSRVGAAAEDPADFDRVAFHHRLVADVADFLSKKVPPHEP